MAIQFSPTDLSLLLTLVITSCSSLILVLQRSTCTRIECLCLKCDRQVRNLRIIEADDTHAHELQGIKADALESTLDGTSRSAAPPEGGTPLRGAPANAGTLHTSAPALTQPEAIV
jgi:hypothetical protein